ncbi:MAG TPA: 4Fe-4S dicluster domain-containing protein [Ignavibacteriaceae bacterium]
MSQRVNLKLKDELFLYGAKDWNQCFQCGNCTATCHTTENDHFFPRKTVRQVLMGLKKSLQTNIDPWLCTYCGDCSKTCPRDANPAEMMMSIRRYLISVYDWTGISKLLYKSKKLELAAIFTLAVIVMVLYLLFTTFPSGDTAQWIGQDGGALINKMAPWNLIHLGDLIMAGGLVALIITNVFYMWYKIIYEDKSLKIGFMDYVRPATLIPKIFRPDKKYAKCDEKKLFLYWSLHLFLALSYAMMFTIIVFFLSWFQTDKVYPIIHPQRMLGYISTIGLFIGIVYFYTNRTIKNMENSRYSHFTDWTFLILLFLTTLTGILVHFFRIYGLPQLTYITYLLHLMVLVPMLCIEVPFSKWSHMIYRPFSLYFAHLKKLAIKNQKVISDNYILQE